MILLDTHVLIWWLTDFNRLGQKTLEMIQESELVHYSAASVFEIEIKKQKLYRMPKKTSEAFQNQGFAEIPISAADVEQISGLNMAGHDPFDQLLLAQSVNRKLTFLTADSKILERGYDFVLDARA